MGVPDTLHDCLVSAYERTESGEHVALAERNTPAFWRAGVPGGGGYATAADLTTFYQMLLNLGALNGTRLLSPRTVQYVTRNIPASVSTSGLACPCTVAWAYTYVAPLR